MSTTASALPALPPTADIRSITERVNMLIRAYNGSIAPPLDLTKAVNFPAPLSAADVMVYMASITPIGSGSVPLCNTGSVGAAGQKWEISVQANIYSATGVQTVAGVQIYDGASFIASCTCVNGWNVVGWPMAVPTSKTVTLSGPTTFTLYGQGNQAGCTALNDGTWIKARRLT